MHLRRRKPDTARWPGGGPEGQRRSLSAPRARGGDAGGTGAGGPTRTLGKPDCVCRLHVTSRPRAACVPVTGQVLVVPEPLRNESLAQERHPAELRGRRPHGDLLSNGAVKTNQQTRQRAAAATGRDSGGPRSGHSSGFLAAPPVS